MKITSTLETLISPAVVWTECIKGTEWSHVAQGVQPYMLAEVNGQLHIAATVSPRK